jgi:hypothetical protein
MVSEQDTKLESNDMYYARVHSDAEMIGICDFCNEILIVVVCDSLVRCFTGKPIDFADTRISQQVSVQDSAVRLPQHDPSWQEQARHGDGLRR